MDEQEMRALDREWAELAGLAKCYAQSMPCEHAPDYRCYPAEYWPPRVSSNVILTFGRIGPWEWLVENAVEWVGEDDEGLPRAYDPIMILYSGGGYSDPVGVNAGVSAGKCVTGQGRTIEEAITRCAVQALKAKSKVLA